MAALPRCAASHVHEGVTWSDVSPTWTQHPRLPSPGLRPSDDPGAVAGRLPGSGDRQPLEAVEEAASRRKVVQAGRGAHVLPAVPVHPAVPRAGVPLLVSAAVRLDL